MKLTDLLPAALPLLACSSVLATPTGTPPPHPQPLPRGHPATVAAVEPRASFDYKLFATKKLAETYQDVSAKKIKPKTVAQFAAQLNLLVEAIYEFDPPDAAEWATAQHKLINVPYKPKDTDEGFKIDVTLFMAEDDATEYMGDALADDSHKRLALTRGSREEKLARYVREKEKLGDLYTFVRAWGARHKTKDDIIRWINRWAMRMDVRNLAAFTHMAAVGDEHSLPDARLVEAHRHFARWGLVQVVKLANNVLERNHEEGSDSESDDDSDATSVSGDGASDDDDDDADSDVDSLYEKAPPSYHDAINAPHMAWINK